MQDSSQLSIDFRQFINRQPITNILNICIELSRKNSDFFKFCNGVLTIHNSSVKWPSFIRAGFNSESIHQVSMFRGIPEYDVFCRLISYNTPIYCTRQPIFDIFKSDQSLIPRDLYDLELQLFNVNLSSNNLPKIVKTFDEFINNLNKFFLFHCWSHLIDYSKFHIAGGCLVTCILENSFLLPGQDVDLFYKGVSFNDYLSCVSDMEKKMRRYFFIKRINNGTKQIINLRLFVNQSIESLLGQVHFIDLQFIFIKANYSPDELITKFDIDITQFSFNGRDLEGTMAGIESIRTSTIINYALNDDDKDYAPVAIRIGKYVKRGFRYLTPLNFNVKRFQACPSYISNSRISSQTQHSNNQYESHIELSFNQYNSIDRDTARNTVFSRNYDCFYVQQNFLSKLSFDTR